MSVRSSPLQNLVNKENQVKKVFATGETVGLAEWIISYDAYLLIILKRVLCLYVVFPLKFPIKLPYCSNDVRSVYEVNE